MQASTMQSTTESGVICTTHHVWPGAPSWRDTPGALDPRLLRRSRLLESLARAFDRSSRGIADRREVQCANYVWEKPLVSGKWPDKWKGSWSTKVWCHAKRESFVISNCSGLSKPVYKSALSTSEFEVEQSSKITNLHSNHPNQKSSKAAKRQTWDSNATSISIETAITSARRKRLKKGLISTQTRHDCGSTENLPDINSGLALGLRGPAVRPLIHGTEASLVPFGNINWV